MDNQDSTTWTTTAAPFLLATNEAHGQQTKWTSKLPYEPKPEIDQEKHTSKTELKEVEENGFA